MDRRDYCEIISFKKEHINPIAEISYKLWGNGGLYSYKNYNNWVNGGISFTLKVNYKVAGCCLCDNLGNGVCSIDLLLIDNIHENKGYGSVLFKFCLDYLKTNKFIFCKLYVCTKNYKAMHLYEKFGFERIKFVRNYYINDKDKDAFIMGKYLDKQYYNNNNIYNNYNYYYYYYY